MASPYIERILKARVYDVAIESPLEVAPRLSRRLGNQVLLKREDLQPVFSFKLRGAYNRIAHLSDSSRAARRGLRLGRQSCAGRGAGGAAPRHPRASSSCRRPRPHIKVQAVIDLGARGGAARRRLRQRLRARAEPSRASATWSSCIPSTIPTSSPARARSPWRSCARRGGDARRDLRAGRAAAACIAGIAVYVKYLYPERARSSASSPRMPPACTTRCRPGGA